MGSPASACRSRKSCAISRSKVAGCGEGLRGPSPSGSPISLGGRAFLERFAERGLVIEVRADRMPGRSRHHVHRHHAEREGGGGPGARQRHARAPRARAHRRADPAQCEFERAKAEADDANVSKTRFIAAASHDILQPLNAARLYVTSLSSVSVPAKFRPGANIDASLEAVEEIFAALLEMSRLDTGAMQPEMTDFRIDELLARLEVDSHRWRTTRDFAQLHAMRARGALRPAAVAAAPANLVSNAIKYTPEGTVLVGCRRRGSRLRIDVYDTGIGIPHANGARCSRNFTGSIRARALPAASGSGSPSSSALGACWTPK